MVLCFEVAQVSISGWAPVLGTRHEHGIFLEISIQNPRSKCSSCIPSLEKHKKKMHCRHRTGVIKEETDMLWRKFNHDGILVALATLHANRPKAGAQDGGSIAISVDVHRVALPDDEGYDVTLSLATASWQPSALTKGSALVVSMQGHVAVGHWGSVSLRAVEEGYLDQEMLLELRPILLRPFSLLNSSPVFADLCVEALFEARNFASRNHNTDNRWGGSRNSSISQISFWKMPRIRKTFSHRKDWSAQDCFQDWVPSRRDWDKMWTDIWPLETGFLYGRYEVVPLMEAEFRRDCIVFFNTLYPRSQNKSFLELRDQALDPDFKAGFKLVPADLESPDFDMDELHSPELVMPDDQEGHEDLRYFCWKRRDRDNPEWDSQSLTESKPSFWLASPVASTNFSMTSASTNLCQIAASTSSAASTNLNGVAGRSSDLDEFEEFARLKRDVPDVAAESSEKALRYLDYRAKGLALPTNPSYGDTGPFPRGNVEEDVYQTPREGKQPIEPRASLYAMMPESPGESTVLAASDSDSEAEAQSLHTEGELESNRSPIPPSQKFVSALTSPHLTTWGPHCRSRKPVVRHDLARISKALEFNMLPVEAEIMKGVKLKFASDNKTIEFEQDSSASRSTWTASTCEEIDQDQFSQWDVMRSPSGQPPKRSSLLQSGPFVRSPNRSSTMGKMFSTGSFKAQSVVALRCVTSSRGSFFDEYSAKVYLLKRLFICFASCGVHYSEADNSSQLGDPWPYPLAAVLGHGGRVLIRLEDVEATEFVNFLLTGDPKSLDWKHAGVPLPLRRRIAATHSVQIEPETGRLCERRLKVGSAADNMQNIKDGIRMRHLGVDLPIAGVGNPSPFGKGYVVGFKGDVLEAETRFRLSVATVKSTVWGFLSSSKSDLSKAQENQQGLYRISSKSSLRTSKSSDGKDSSRTSFSCRPVPDMQSGHLYMRLDSFGEQMVSSAWGSACGDTGSFRAKLQAIRRDLLGHHRKDWAPRPATPVNFTTRAGILLFPSEAEYALDSSSFHRRLSRHAVRSREHCGGLTLLRVRSEPSIVPLQHSDASREDKRWANYVIMMDPDERVELPPSPTALRLVLEYFDPVNSPRFGTSNFKSFEDLYGEVQSSHSYLVKQKNGILRMVEPTIVQLYWGNHVLMLRFEVAPGKDKPVEKDTFIATRTRPEEDWEMAAARAIREELNVDSVSKCIKPFFDDENSHTELEETRVSPSYPGLLCSYRTHMVVCYIREDAEDFWTKRGMQIPEAVMRRGSNRSVSSSSRASVGYGCDFVTTKDVSGGKKQMFWRWMPELEAQRVQSFLNMREATPDERWAKYAYQEDGIVRYPPSEAALAILLRRCGVDVGMFGTGKYKALRDFYLELTNQDCYLQMLRGRPSRMAEATFVRLKWRSVPDEPYDVLVQVFEQRPDGRSSTRKSLLSTRKRKEETWEDSAIRCVVQDLCITKQQLKGLLSHRTNDLSGYLFCEEFLQEAVSYPGIKGTYRTHLVTWTIKEGFTAVTHGILQGTNYNVDGSMWPGRTLSMSHYETWSRPGSKKSVKQKPVPPNKPQETDPSAATPVHIDSPGLQEKKLQTSRETAAGQKVINFEWLEESKLDHVKGANLWDRAVEMQERRQVSSVLIGLESSAPMMKSPFGHRHDMSGKSNPISALGNHKWAAYRVNNQYQIPSNENGLRMRITKDMFVNLQRTCHNLDLIDPGMDLISQPGQVYSRSYIDRRYAEQEMFQRLLSGNARYAKDVLRWMEEYRNLHPTLAQRYERVERRTVLGV